MRLPRFKASWVQGKDDIVCMVIDDSFDIKKNVYLSGRLPVCLCMVNY